VWTMPVYEYKCTKCGKREEHILRFSDEHPTTCAACGGELKRAWGGRVHVSLEGWGFSKTDGLVAERGGPRRDFKELKRRAEQIRDE
jgi:putative FmdB family regulatory protein